MHLFIPALLLCLSGAHGAQPNGIMSRWKRPFSFVRKRAPPRTPRTFSSSLPEPSGGALQPAPAAPAPAAREWAEVQQQARLQQPAPLYPALGQRAPAELAKVQLRTLQGAQLEVDAQASDTVAEVKYRAEIGLGIPRGEQTLVYGGKKLEDARTLGEYRVKNEARFILISAYWKLGEYKLTVRSRADGPLGPPGQAILSLPAPSPDGDSMSARELQSRLEALITEQWPAFAEREGYEKTLLYLNTHDSSDERCGTESVLGLYQPSLVNHNGEGVWVSKRILANLASLGSLFPARRAWINYDMLQCGEFWIGEEEVICQRGRYREPNCEHTDEEEAEWGAPRTDNFISMEGITKGVCIDMKCYDATTLREWLEGHGTVPHNFADMSASLLDALLASGSLAEREASVRVFREG